MPRAQATDEATMIPENRTPNQIPETTKAATFRRYGLPHVVEVVDRDLPDLGPGDVLAVMLPNRVELLVAMFSAWRLGGAMTPVLDVRGLAYAYPDYRTALTRMWREKSWQPQ